jgi:hypothetical protein
LIKLLVNLVYLPKPFYIKDLLVQEEILQKSIDLVWGLAVDQGKNAMFELLAPLVLSSSIGTTWLLSKDRLNSLIKSTVADIKALKTVK